MSQPVFSVLVPLEHGGHKVELFSDRQTAHDFARPFGATVQLTVVDAIADKVKPEATVRNIADTVVGLLEGYSVMTRKFPEDLKVARVSCDDHFGIVVVLENDQQFRMTVEELARA